MVVQLLVFYYVVLPIIGTNLPSVSVAIVVFGLNSGAYISEIMRSGIQSVDYGQMEGGRSVGLSFSTTMMRIVIPQAVKNILPTLGNEFIALIKETSVFSAVALADLMYVAKDLIGLYYKTDEALLMLVIAYLIILLPISLLASFVERQVRYAGFGN